MIEVAHYSALVPLLALVLFKRDAPAPYWLVALGFSVSWFADSAAVYMEGMTVTRYYPAVQLGLFGMAFRAYWLAPVLIVLAVLVGAPTAGPEFVVTALGSIAVLWLAVNHELRWSMLAYCGAASAFYVAFATEVATGRFMMLWYPYQVSRLAGFGLFLGAAYHWREA